MKIYMIRHGETEWNVIGRIQGREDIPLSADGVRQVRRTGAAFEGAKLGFIVSSPLSRAVRTASEIAERTGAAIHTDERLIERDFGELSGTPMRGIAPGITAPGMESMDEVAARMYAAVTDWAKKTESDFAVVSHGGSMTSLLRLIDRWDGKTILGNASVCVLSFDGKLGVLDWNMDPDAFRAKYISSGNPAGPLQVRSGGAGDVDDIMRIYAAAREYMRATGNPSQWVNGYPYRWLVEKDVEEGRNYVVTDENGGVCGTFVFTIGEDPTYVKMKSGAWKKDGPYGVIHRVAGDGKKKGIFGCCLRYCLGRIGNIRIDTHRDNLTMRRVLAKNGFVECGTIITEDGGERIAYQLTV